MKETFMTTGILISFLLALSFTLEAAQVTLKSGESCASTCSGKSKIVKFEDGQVYKYKLSTTQSVKNPNDDSENVKLLLTGMAEIYKLSGCDFALKLSDMKYEETLKSKSEETKKYPMFVKMLEKFPIRFGYDDGRVKGVCPENNDNEFAVNVKKSILSAMQISLDGLDAPNYLTETDISGDCLTEYSTKPNPPNFVIVTKTKSTGGCARKKQYFSKVSGQLIESPNEGRNIPLVDGTYNCEMKIKREDGLKETTCKEIHTFKPMNRESSGSSIEVIQKLTFDSSVAKTITVGAPVVRTDLIMNHGEIEPLTIKTTPPDSEATLMELCSAMEKNNAITSEITSGFVDLIQSLSGNDLKTIKKLAKTISTNPKCKSNKDLIESILYDALSNTNSEAALSYIMENDDTLQSYGMAFSSIQDPTDKMIGDLSKKLSVSNKVFLMLSNMINTYCSNNVGCMKNAYLKQAMDTIVNSLSKNCAGLTKEKTVMFALRAIKSIGDIYEENESLLKALKQCVTKKENDYFVKEFAVESLRNFPCDPDVDEFLWQIFEDVSYGPELRIHAYLGLSRCPTRETFGRIISGLEKEESQQLGSFVWSHISNLLETSDPFKINTRDMLQIFSDQIKNMEKSFNLDFRSYSKNYEKSYQRGYSAAKVESNVIFTDRSPMPSSMSANVTMDFYGRSVNFMELGIRSEGMYDKIMGAKVLTKPHGNLDPNVAKMDMEMDMNKSPLRPRVSVHARMVGYDIFFSPDLLTTILTRVVSIPTSQSAGKSIVFMNNILSIAMVSGFPLQIQIEGAATGQMTLTRNAGIGMANAKLNARLNVALQVKGKLQINGHCTKIGVQSLGQVSTDSEFGGQIKISPSIENNVEKSVYDFVIDKIPDNRKLLAFSNELSLIHTLKKSETMPTMKNILDKCTADGLEKVLGMKLCASLDIDKTSKTFLPNIKGGLKLNTFNGMKMNVESNTDISVPGLPKIQKFKLAVGFADAKEDSFRVKMERNMAEKKQKYELLLWNKNVYFNLDIDKEKVSGEIIYGKRKGTLSGELLITGILNSALVMEIKGDFPTIRLHFKQMFSKAGPQITIKLDQDGKDGFSLSSRTELKLTKHKLYNFFQRYRHSTKLSLPGKNNMSLSVDYSLGNQPTIEIKSAIKAYWTTNDKTNFNINNEFSWFRRDKQSENVLDYTGTHYNVLYSQNIQYKEKKFNLKYDVFLFKSNNMLSFPENPIHLSFGITQTDLIKSEERFKTSSTVSVAMAKSGAGKILLDGFLSYPSVMPTQNFLINTTWSPVQMANVVFYKIDGIFKANDNEFLTFKHNPVSDTKVNTNIAARVKGYEVLLDSSIEIPKSHKLIIVVKNGTTVTKYEQLTTIVRMNYEPFDFTFKDVLKRDDQLFLKMHSNIKFDKSTKLLKMFSKGLDSKENVVYDIKMNSKSNVEKTDRLVIDIGSSVDAKIPVASMEYKNDIGLYFDWKSKYVNNMKKLFKFHYKVDSKSVQGAGNRNYGWSFLLAKKNDMSEIKNKSYWMFDKNVFMNEYKEGSTLKYYLDNKHGLFNVKVESTNLLKAKVEFKIQGGYSKELKVSRSFYFKTLPSNKLKYFIKSSSVLNIGSKRSMYVYIGKTGKSDKKNDVAPYQGKILLEADGTDTLGLLVILEHPLLRKLDFAKIEFSTSYQNKKAKNDKYAGRVDGLVKWQKIGMKVSKFYEIASLFETEFSANGKALIDFNVDLTKDEPTNKIGNVKFNIFLKNMKFKSKVDLKYKKDFGGFTFNFEMNKKLIIKTKLMSSFKFLKVISWESDVMLFDLKKSGQFNGIHKLIVKSYNINYKIDAKVNRRIVRNKMKFDFVENFSWKSNVPYLKSGLIVMGFLTDPKNSKFEYKIKWDNINVGELKLSQIMKYKVGKISFTSSLKIPIVLKLNWNAIDDLFKSDMDVTIDDKYFRIKKFNLYKKLTNSFRQTTDLVIHSTIPKWEIIEISQKMSMDLGNYKTFKYTYTIKSKSKLKQFIKIDLPKGKIELKNYLSIIKVVYGFDSAEIGINWDYKSMKDHTISASVKIEPKIMDMTAEWTHFRDDAGKTIKGFGEVYMYNLLEYKRDKYYLNWLMAIDKSKTKGNGNLSANLSFMDKSTDLVFKLSKFSKVKSDLYSGNLDMNGNQYTCQFKYENPKKMQMDMSATLDQTKPKMMKIELNMDDKVKMLFSADKYMLFDFDISSDKTKGYLKTTYKSKTYADLTFTRKAKVPNDNFLQNLQDLFSNKVGYDVTYKTKGTIGDYEINEKIKYVRQSSKTILGGIKSVLDYSLNIKGIEKGSNKYDIAFQVSFNRNFPKVMYIQKAKYKKNDQILFHTIINMQYIHPKYMILKLTYYIPQAFTFLLNLERTEKSTELMFKYNKNTLDIIYNKKTNVAIFALDIPQLYSIELKTDVLKIKKLIEIQKYGNIKEVNEQIYFKYDEYKLTIIKERGFIIKIQYDSPDSKKPLKFKTELDYVDLSNMTIKLKGSSDYEAMKFFTCQVGFKREDLKKFELNSFTDLNRKQLYNITLKLNNKHEKKSQLKMKYKGSYVINAEFKVDKEKVMISHQIKVSDGKFKRELWQSKSHCQMKSGFICNLKHINKARQMKFGVIVNEKIKEFELTWNKKEAQSVIFHCSMKKKTKTLSITIPWRKFELKSNKRDKWILINIEKPTDTKTDNIMMKIDYKLKGDPLKEYELEMKLKSNLLRKKLDIYAKRTLNSDNKLYSFLLNIAFENSKVPILELDGYFQKSSSKSFKSEVSINTGQNSLTFTTNMILALEEIKIECNVTKVDKKTSSYLLHMVPFRKFLLTNNKQFKILLSRMSFQNGFKSEAIVKLDAAGPNIMASSSFSRSPLKYYAEIISNNKKLVIYMRPTRKRFYGEIYRSEKGIKYLDASIFVQKDNKNIVNSELYWKPDIISNIKKTFNGVFEPKRIKTMMNQCYSAINTQVFALKSNVQLDIGGALKLVDALNVMKRLMNDLETMPELMTKSYENDDLYMKKMMSSVKTFINDMDLKDKMTKASEFCSEQSTKLSKLLYGWFVDANLYAETYKPIKKMLNLVSYDKMKNGIKKFINTINSCISRTKKIMNKIANQLDKLAEAAQKASKKTVKAYNGLVDLIKQSKMYEVVVIMRQIRSDILEAVGKVVDMQIVKDRMKYYEDVINTSKFIIKVMSTARQQMIKYVRSTSMVSTVINTIDLVKSMKYKEAFLNLMKPEETELKMNLSKASITMKFYMSPVLKPMVMMMKAAYRWMPMQTLYQTRKMGFTNKLLELFYQYEYVFFNYNSLEAWKKLMPPFSKSAFVINGNNLVTFDGNSVRLGSGNCHFVLVRDSRHKSFTITMEMKEKNEKVFTLYHLKKVSIYSKSQKVTVDDKEIDTLPVVYKDLSGRKLFIYRNQDKIKVKTSEGLKMKYFPQFDTLKVILGGFWHGKVRGLLGSNDFEKVNDLSTPNGRILYDNGVLAKEWAITKCESNTKTGLYKIRVNTKHLQKCADLFSLDSNSYLKRCFSLVDPEPYLELCSQSLQYKKYNDKKFKSDVLCVLSRNYVNRCKSQNMLLRLDKSCITCGNKKHNKMISQTLNKNIKKFNYIFIIEQSKCLSNYKGLINKLAEAMHIRKNSKFTLMSYDSKLLGKWVHLKTYKNKISTNINNFKKLVSQFWMDEYLTSYKMKSPSPQPMEALFQALKLNNMPEYKDRIILLSCAKCDKNTKYIYSLLAGMIKNRDVSITYLTTQDFTGSEANAQSAGVSKDKTYEFTPDNSIKTSQKSTFVQPPSDQCSALALLEGGSVWSLKNINNEPRIRRVIDKINENIGQSTIGLERSRNCYCAYGKYEFGKVQCTFS